MSIFNEIREKKKPKLFKDDSGLVLKGVVELYGRVLAVLHEI